jgi:hypothetical protein
MGERPSAPRRARFIGIAAFSVAAVASVVNAPSANAQIICEECPPDLTPPGFLKAELKLAELKFPGESFLGLTTAAEAFIASKVK